MEGFDGMNVWPLEHGPQNMRRREKGLINLEDIVTWKRAENGLKRTGKSCRLRWLNYLRPDVRRGNITPEEQLLILELHSRWGNRWSKIAQHLPGRTDNEIKNYWRTRVQKHAKQLKCDVNSKQFKDVMRYLWMPRLHRKNSGGERLGRRAAEYQNLAPAWAVTGPRPRAGEAQLSPPSTVTAGEDKGGGGVQLRPVRQ
ncbi:uncharacterized protein A4U43_C05F1830 [Asparagus officinalis]|uniref:Uncharacterized protein n=1 Tax=Asparagus officinalis TaxID=4686 RepID=A0A5P1ENV0_ASPOF|nr:uncharacterized protein A4U43_C05F1830 [Asparagus officinalis]